MKKEPDAEGDYDPSKKLGGSYHIIAWDNSDSFATEYTAVSKNHLDQDYPLNTTRSEELRAVEVEVPEILGDSQSIVIKFVPK